MCEMHEKTADSKAETFQQNTILSWTRCVPKCKKFFFNEQMKEMSGSYVCIAW